MLRCVARKAAEVARRIAADSASGLVNEKVNACLAVVEGVAIVASVWRDMPRARSRAAMTECTLRWHAATASAKDTVLESLLGIAALVDGTVELRDMHAGVSLNP